MSKIGKKNIKIPKDSSIKIEGANLTITGPKGTKKLTINDKIFSSKNLHLLAPEFFQSYTENYQVLIDLVNLAFVSEL